MIWFKDLFRKEDLYRKNKSDVEDLNRNVRYMYMIIGSQIFLVFVITGFMMTVGAFMATPWWIILGIFIMAMGFCVHLYRKAKKKWRELKEAIKQINLSDKNYEISIMGGILTMRIEHSPRALVELQPVGPPKVLPAPEQEKITEIEKKD